MGKNILVFGASSGIGYDLALSLITAGHNVYCGARRLGKLQQLQALGAKVFKVDVRDRESIDIMVDSMIEHHGSIDIVYSNAGYPIAGPVEVESIENAQSQLDTNLLGPARIAKAVLPYMRKQRRGRIVFTTSIAARTASSMNGWYTASKHALSGMAKTLAQEVEEFNIKIVLVEPGCVQTELPDIQLNDMLSKADVIEDYRVPVEKAHRFLKKAYDSGSNTDSTVKALLSAGFREKPKLIYQSTVDAKFMAWTQKIKGESSFGRFVSFVIRKVA
ncbi:SDR family NAD(P)-dependent oxidoreductase [Vibrio variabilis]|uniref:SDR family NAD(P)-dependent oxidoreductase n=1 Tax=Vibrio variabilis TaxID=990271 RepID=UPI000DDBE603|nr:SDR family NAD(P)-dependent oxidoreductase [Vibrio variabilis]